MAKRLVPKDESESHSKILKKKKSAKLHVVTADTRIPLLVTKKPAENAGYKENADYFQC